MASRQSSRLLPITKYLSAAKIRDPSFNTEIEQAFNRIKDFLKGKVEDQDQSEVKSQFKNMLTLQKIHLELAETKLALSVMS